MIIVEGKNGIKATILKDSVSEAGIRLITYELEYPRLILAELNTHNMLVKNSFSSRATPFAKMIEQLTGRPVRFGANQSGMQDKGEDYDATILYQEGADCFEFGADEAWTKAQEEAVKWAKGFFDAGYHKQIYNRLLEPFQMMKTVLSGTELQNFFWLRKHDAADPTLEELAKCMFEARKQSTPEQLKAGEWHLPYVTTYRDAEGVLRYGDWVPNDVLRDMVFKEYNLEEAIKVSSARTAAVSFRNVDYDVEKSCGVYERLVGDARKHASAMAHQATPMKPAFDDSDAWHNPESVNLPTEPDTWEAGVSHMTRDKQLWSAQFKGWVMHRKLIPGENYTGEIE